MPEAAILRWSSDAFKVYVRASMEDPVWVSDLLGDGVGEYEAAGTRD